MAYTEIDYTCADGVATITLDRPDRLNAFTIVMRGELIDAFDRADADDEVRAVIVTGRGRAFCAGADLERGGDTFNHDASRDMFGGQETFEDGAPRDGGGTVALRIARSLKKYRRKMKRKERWQRLENQSPWEAYIESRFKGVCIVLGACIIIGIGLAITRLWTHP